jgi:hypothetical protein
MMMTRQMKAAGCVAFEILVDNATARENVCRTAESRGWKADSVAEANGDCRIALSRK